MEFQSSDIVSFLSESNSKTINDVEFGVIGFDNDGVIQLYNDVEEELSGLSKEKVLEKHLFTHVAPCMNNHLVANRFAKEEQIDEVIPYVFSLKIKPMPVTLRLLKQHELPLNYILVHR